MSAIIAKSIMVDLDRECERSVEFSTINNIVTNTPQEYSVKKDQPVDIRKLSAQVQEINKRLTKLEYNFHHGASSFTNRFSGECLYMSDELQLNTGEVGFSGAGKSALAVVNHDLITSKPHNESISNQLWSCVMVAKRYNFAMLQCVLIFVAAAALLTYGVFQFVEADNSVRDPYKPYKVDGRDEYYRNEELQYKLPLHYFWFELSVIESNFYPIYNATFNESCNSTLRDCLNIYIDDYFNPDIDDYSTPNLRWMNPTDLPSTSPSPYPTFSPTPATSYPTKNPTKYPTSDGLNYVIEDVTSNVQYYTMDDVIYNAPLTAYCLMTTSSNGTVTTETARLRNLTIHLDTIGVNLETSSDITDIFGMLLRLEFEDFDGYMSGKIMCDLYLEMERLDMAIGDFATVEILFMVSREKFNSGTTGITEYIRSMKKVWRKQYDLIDQIYSYVFEENTFDGESDFTAEVHLVDEYTNSDALLNIEVYPFPTVMHYVSFDRYSYLDWLADVGGFYTLVVSFFFILSSRITKLANRRENFISQYGILPAFSLSHRNAEELSALRSLVLAALGITEKDYFSKNMDKKLTLTTMNVI